MTKEIDEKESLLKNLEKVDPLTMLPVSTHHHQLVVAEKVQVGFDLPLFQPISFTLTRGDRIAIVGDNGSGKSTLIRALLKQFTGMQSGHLTLAPVSLSLVRQQYTDNRGTLVDFAKQHQLSRETLLNNLRKLGMPRADFNTPIEHLSMGQQKSRTSAIASHPGRFVHLGRTAQLFGHLQPRPTGCRHQTLSTNDAFCRTR